MRRFQLAPLPYAPHALEPYLARETIRLHYEKHHAGYVAKLNELVAGRPEQDATLETLIRRADGPVFDHAAQVWNHDFYWRSMDPDGGGAPSDALAEAVTAAFGSIEGFRGEFLEMGESHFGSGWLWLVAHAGHLRLVATPDADTPLRYGDTPLLCADLWEHAYYLDYRDERSRYLKVFFDDVASWEFAQSNWAAASGLYLERRAAR